MWFQTKKKGTTKSSDYFIKKSNIEYNRNTALKTELNYSTSLMFVLFFFVKMLKNVTLPLRFGI